MVMKVRSELQFSPTVNIYAFIIIYLHNFLNIVLLFRIILPSSSVIWIFDSTFAELEFLSPISSVIKRCQICKSASTTVSKRETFFECFKTQRAVIIP
ncbi:hypothetical protein T02_895 [Trichinella nativa]|uniref:Uncharacterized protein n=1 Tax=Trichinella nativa TaxID=6335 RepID=A0A0V1LQH8_9BILA|nr:hypothetical protein T02_895 [Trichinella nativa]